MTHKGGERAKKIFPKIHLSKSAKERIENLPHNQLLILLHFIEALLASSSRTVHAGKRKARSGAKKARRKLSAGVHTVRVNGRERKVRVNAKGQWRFMKG